MENIGKTRETFWAGDVPFFEGVFNVTFAITLVAIPLLGTWIAINGWGALSGLLIGFPVFCLIAFGMLWAATNWPAVRYLVAAVVLGVPMALFILNRLATL
ncbi:hypothetical protein [Novosphingobium terrae]|uniref:hypothetical protein n=1 Tax=Novosphingobium terrae TaxID=2726189 RepID=UPI0019802EC6|nr:hypothetical protein [Novosphingobium terrae]